MFRFLKENINFSGEEASALQDYIVYLAHEIKTPLNSIYGNLAILKKECCPKNRYLDNALLSAEYLINFVNSTLTIAEMENDISVIKSEAITMEELFKYSERMLELTAAEKNIKLQFLFEETVYQYLYLNKAAIQQIIINLISNSIKYTNEGGTVICRVTQEYLEEKRVKLFIKIEDNGIGMEEDFALCVWDEYARENRKKEESGTGLGMSITKRLVQLLGGRIEMETQAGSGSRVIIELEADADDIIYDAIALSKEETAKMPAIPKRALVAEDECANMGVMCKYLEMLGIKADRAYDGAEVIDIFEKSEENFYDVILMDINLPVKSGIEAVREIRGLNRADSRMPIVVMTADSLERHRADMISGEINGYIVKPYRIEDIDAALLNIWGNLWHEAGPKS